MSATYINGTKVAYAYEKLTSITASTALTAATYLQSVSANDVFSRTRTPHEAYITVEDADVRVTFDGTTPTVSAGTGAGHLYGHGDTITIQGFENIVKFRAINAVASNGAVLRVTYFRL